MRKITFIILAMLAAVSCVEDFVPDIKESDVRRVVVDAVLTTDTTAHCVRLSASAPYGTPSERIPVISGASVRLSDGTSQIELNEDPGTGCYYTPEDYYANKYATISRFSGDSIYDKTNSYILKNTFAIALLEGFNKWAKAGLKGFITHDLRHYVLPDTATATSTTSTSRTAPPNVSTVCASPGWATATGSGSIRTSGSFWRSAGASLPKMTAATSPAWNRASSCT